VRLSACEFDHGVFAGPGMGVARRACRFNLTSVRVPVPCSPDSGRPQENSAPALVGFWSLLTNKLALEDSGNSMAGAGVVGSSAFAGEDTIILRADGQVAGGPRVPGWEDSGVAWASEQRAAGGSWREYVDDTGKRRVEVALLLPPASAAAREKLPSDRPALFYDGIILEMRDFDFKGSELAESTVVRVVGTVSTGQFRGSVSDRVAVSKFSMLKKDIGKQKLFQSVIPFARPFGSPVADSEEAAAEGDELASVRDRDHDPAGLHKLVDTERQMMEGLYGGEWSGSPGGGAAGMGMNDDGSTGGASRASGGGQGGAGGGDLVEGLEELSGDELEDALQQRVSLQRQINDEKDLLRGIMDGHGGPGGGGDASDGSADTA
jgi:hypothetical protein